MITSEEITSYSWH